MEKKTKKRTNWDVASFLGWYWMTGPAYIFEPQSSEQQLRVYLTGSLRQALTMIESLNMWLTLYLFILLSPQIMDHHGLFKIWLEKNDQDRWPNPFGSPLNEELGEVFRALCIASSPSSWCRQPGNEWRGEWKDETKSFGQIRFELNPKFHSAD